MAASAFRSGWAASMLCGMLLGGGFVGCDSGAQFDYASVSGKVTLDGMPVSGAFVVFVPSTDRQDGLAAKYSKGLTDDDGRFTLRTVEKDPYEGAAVGVHRVIVSTYRTQSDPDDPSRAEVVSQERIPSPYNDQRITDLTFTVEPGGTTKADFDLTTRPRR